MECCIKESLRLYPSVPAIMRHLTEDVVIGLALTDSMIILFIYRPWTRCFSGGHTIPAGVSIALMIYGMHHNPLVYEDPEIFKPERFSGENSSERHPYSFIPFSAGPRNCIGTCYNVNCKLEILININCKNVNSQVRNMVCSRSKPCWPICWGGFNLLILILGSRCLCLRAKLYLSQCMMSPWLCQNASLVRNNVILF